MSDPAKSPTHPQCLCAEIYAWAQWNCTVKPWSSLTQRLYHVKQKTWTVDPAKNLKVWAGACCQTCVLLVKAIDRVLSDAVYRTVRLSLCNFVRQLKVTTIIEAALEGRDEGRRKSKKDGDVEQCFYISHPKGKTFKCAKPCAHRL